MTQLKGYDISEHNGDIDIKKLKENGAQFVMIRAGYSTVQDVKFKRNVLECEKYGLNYGVYWYSYSLSYNDALLAAKACIKAIYSVCVNTNYFTYPIAVDIEDADGWKKQHGWSYQQEIEVIKAWKQVIEQENGLFLQLYCSASWYKAMKAIDATTIDSLSLWLAHWGVGSPSYTCDVWQYTSNEIFDGKRIDANYSYVDFKTLLKDGKVITQETQEPIETDLPFNVGDTVQFMPTYYDDRITSYAKDNKYEVMAFTPEGYVQIGVNGVSVAITDAYRLMKV